MERSGTYFREDGLEVIALTDGEESLPAGAWQHVTEQAGLTLMAVREMLIAGGLVSEQAAKRVYWHMPQPEEEGRGIFAA